MSDTNYIVINRQDKCFVIYLNKLNYVYSSGPYIHFNIDGGAVVTSSQLIGKYKKVLLSNSFVNPHRSYFINLRRIKEIVKIKSKGIVQFMDNTELETSRDLKNEIIKLLEINSIDKKTTD